MHLTQPSTCAPVAIVVVAGVCLGFWSSMQPDPKGVRFDPPLFDFSTEFVVEGEVFTADTQLCNSGSQPVSVTYLSRSCGCMAFSQQGGDLKLPFTLLPGEKKSLRLSINTARSSGPKLYEMVAHGRSQQVVAQFAVRLNVSAAMQAVPSEVYVNQSRNEASTLVSAKVAIGDDWPNGLKIREITSTAPDRFRISVAPQTGTLTAGLRQLTKRYELDIEYRVSPTENEVDELITVVPDHAKASPLVIPVKGRIIPPFEFSPNGLTFYGKPGEVLSRVVECRFADDADIVISFGSIPDGMTLKEIGREGGRIQFMVEYQLPVESTQEKVQFKIGKAVKLIVFPVVVSVDST